jgi:thiol-disulfide isomerase/thioredoxin
MKKIALFLMALLLAGHTLQAAKADRFTLETLDGKNLRITGLENGFDLQKYRGKIVFLEFWGTQCPPCLISIPHYIDLQKKYKDRLAIVSIEVQGAPKEYLRRFVAAKGINYTVIPYENARNFVQYVQMRTGWEGAIPYLVILDQEGGYVTGQVGMLSQNALEGVIDELEKIHSRKAKKAPVSDGNTTEKAKGTE